MCQTRFSEVLAVVKLAVVIAEDYGGDPDVRERIKARKERLVRVVKDVIVNRLIHDDYLEYVSDAIDGMNDYTLLCDFKDFVSISK